jgi:hypothetical protein
MIMTMGLNCRAVELLSWHPVDAGDREDEIRTVSGIYVAYAPPVQSENAYGRFHESSRVKRDKYDTELKLQLAN